jgi:hypothetical protein
MLGKQLARPACVASAPGDLVDHSPNGKKCPPVWPAPCRVVRLNRTRSLSSPKTSREDRNRSPDALKLHDRVSKVFRSKEIVGQMDVGRPASNPIRWRPVARVSGVRPRAVQKQSILGPFCRDWYTPLTSPPHDPAALPRALPGPHQIALGRSFT